MMNLIKYLNKFFDTKYNWSSIVLSGTIWCFSSNIIPYYTQGLGGMSSSMIITQYIVYVYMLGILLGYLKNNQKLLNLAVVGILSTIFYISLGYLTINFCRLIAYFIFKPIYIFVFLNICKELLSGEHKQNDSIASIDKR